MPSSGQFSVKWMVQYCGMCPLLGECCFITDSSLVCVKLCSSDFQSVCVLLVIFLTFCISP